MAAGKHIDVICFLASIAALVVTVLFMNGSALGAQAADREIGYESSLFDASRVHTIDIIMDDWDAFLETAQSEEYSICSVVIDGESVKNVGIRGKGNTSLSTVARSGSDRYSFKIEFDQYDSTKRFHGLDKLCLNNIIQDNTYMKDYLTYQMMSEFGVAAPLCSYAYLTVNGEDWGLYLAVEAVEESFLQRNYGSDYGELYKPDSVNMGGGRGNGKDFDMADFKEQLENAGVSGGASLPDAQGKFGNRGGMQMPGASSGESGGTPSGQGFDPETMPKGFGGMRGGMDSSQTKLQYIDDDPDSYSAIFDSAKTEISEADKSRLIASLKQLSNYENLENVVDIDEVLRYFVVHNYVVNGDSYTGSMVHNYYLYEKDGRLSMIPWDYNLAFGTFQSSNAASAANDDIDQVLTDRPMQAWIFSDEAYSQQYYTLYAQLLNQVDVQDIIDRAYELIAPYVEKDPTAFCTYAEFQTGVQTLKAFCSLRTESVRLQLAGSSETVDAGTLNLSDMGTMGGGMGGFRVPDASGGTAVGNSDNAAGAADGDTGAARPGGMPPPAGTEMPEGMQLPDASSQPDQGAENAAVPPGGENGFQPGNSSGSSAAAQPAALMLTGLSALFLLAGILIAAKTKHR